MINSMLIPVEPDWERDIDDTAKEVFEIGQRWQDNFSYAEVLINNEIRKLVNKLTEHWY
jgi:hypothetical protein